MDMVIPPMKTHGTGVVKDPIEFACCAKQVLLVEAKIFLRDPSTENKQNIMWLLAGTGKPGSPYYIAIAYCNLLSHFGP